MIYIPPIYQSRHSETDQNGKTLHQTLDEFLKTGHLDVTEAPESYDFDSADDVDFNKPLAHDVDLLDAACGNDDPFFGVNPLRSEDIASATEPETKSTNMEEPQITQPENES